ncbi:MAG: four helix bundle protein [bacterium]|nr:four helix bundle protein [bacterium]
MSNPPPPTRLLPVLERLKCAYLLWYGYYQTLPKAHRHTLGGKADGLFVETIEAIASATFLSKGEKQPWVRLAIRKLDTLKVLLLVLWETKSLDTKKYAALSLPLEEVGRMLGGWNGQLTKQNSTPLMRGEK